MLDEANGVALGFLQQASERLNGMGLDLSVSTDMEEFVQETHAAKPGTLSPTHDPNKSILDAYNSYWVKVTSKTEVIGMIATRIFRTDSFASLVESNRVWWDKHPVPVYPVEILDWTGVSSVRGCVAFSAGLYTSDKFRNQGIGKLISRVTRAHAFLNFEPDFHTSFIRSDNFEKNLPGNNYMSGNSFYELLHGFYPPLKKNLHIRLAYMKPESVIEALRDAESPRMLRSNSRN